ncbi:hypothetical protein PF004_g23368 [Phytophthora fragariae]|uniref:RxLR effector protein n=1 Tax=Phytophthora fragariae TaxID=53985 RepID=A0A6A3DYP4_9STRA|nr:hypothetical protein PF009_g25305 [Phytophthora fragariae]KAE8978366.1 hypothetical protein PF011_g23272 [Phytophthora fragariae]KAE9185417.1 hypothetical protein PF004_g23368 [Phytophthora fragariae]KAE9323442.1 hypothetical protein PF008_g17353 [Phytophthora fragariae]
MFSSSKIAALCLAAVALSSGAHAEQEAAQTFGLLAEWRHGSVSATPTVALESEALPELALEQVPEQLLESVLEETRA